MITKWVQRFLAASARSVIKREKPVVVAITGSVGKSSVKEAIGVALGAREAGSTVRVSPKNYNNEYGVPLTILGAHTAERSIVQWSKILFGALWFGSGIGRTGVKIFVLEMGADRKGDLAWLTSIAPPKVSVITAVAPAHAEFFGTVEDVAHEKATLVRAVAKDGLVILNADDAHVTAMRKETEAKVAYVGWSDGSDVRIHDARVAVDTDEHGHGVPRGISVALEMDGEVSRLELRGTVGRPQASSAAFAFAVARHFNVPIQTALDRLERDYHGIPGRTRIIPGIKGTTIIDDSYNAASPTAVISGLRDVASLELSSGTQRRIAALGDMRELGAYSEEAHRSVGHEVASLGFDMLVICGTLAAGMADAAREAGLPEASIIRCDDAAEAGLRLQRDIRHGDIIFVKGSQGSRMERVAKELMAEPLQAPFLLVRMTSDWADRP